MGIDSGVIQLLIKCYPGMKTSDPSNGIPENKEQAAEESGSKEELGDLNSHAKWVPEPR